MTRAIPWARLGLDMMTLGAEAGGVMALRMMHLSAGGPKAAAEAQLMVAEKVRAAAELQSKIWLAAMSGGTVSPQATITHYRRKVRANRRRLSRS